MHTLAAYFTLTLVVIWKNVKLECIFYSRSRVALPQNVVIVDVLVAVVVAVTLLVVVLHGIMSSFNIKRIYEAERSVRGFCFSAHEKHKLC